MIFTRSDNAKPRDIKFGREYLLYTARYGRNSFTRYTLDDPIKLHIQFFVSIQTVISEPPVRLCTNHIRSVEGVGRLTKVHLRPSHGVIKYHAAKRHVTACVRLTLARCMCDTFSMRLEG
jgi:hypothetical protein